MNSQDTNKLSQPNTSASKLETFSKENLSKSNSMEIPSISFPKGGGAIGGIDEKFQANTSNGTAGISIPRPLTAARNGSAPPLSLSYNSGSGDGLFGLGWSAEVPSIQRKGFIQMATCKKQSLKVK